MTDVETLDGFLAAAHVGDAVFALRPDYRAILLAVDGLVPSALATRTATRCCRRPKPRPARH
jgi:hypothetical protein